LQGDWTKGPAGSGETDWINGGDNRMDQKAGCLAESWEIPQLGTIIFHIRDDVYWHDKPPVNGRQLLPEDIEWSLERALGGGYFKYSYPTMCATIEITSDNDAWTVTCTVPEDQWVALVTLIPDYTSIAPREAIELWGDQTKWERSLGTGPFILTKWVSNSKAIFNRNPNYWETNPIGPGKGDQLPYIDEYQVLIIPEPSTRHAAFRVGSVDSLVLEYPNDATGLIKELGDKIESYQYTSDSAYCMYFRTDLPESPFSVKEVRQAMMLAIDQPSVVEDYWQGEAIILGWPLTAHIAYDDAMPDLEELSPFVQSLYGHDVAAARALLATTPYPDGFDCSIICWDTPIMVDILSQYQAMLAEININMELDVLDYSVYLGRTRARNHGPYEIMYTTDAGNGTYLKMIDFRGPSSYNVSYVNNPPGTDPTIEAAYQAVLPLAGVDEAAMMAISKELVQDYLLEQAYAINSPSPIMTNLWWTWVKNYYGCVYVGYYNSYGTPKYVWIDEDLKESMGY